MIYRIIYISKIDLEEEFSTRGLRPFWNLNDFQRGLPKAIRNTDIYIIIFNGSKIKVVESNKNNAMVWVSTT